MTEKVVTADTSNFTLSVRMIEDKEDVYDFIVSTKLPNALYSLGIPVIGCPNSISLTGDEYLHITIPVDISGELRKLSSFSPVPVSCRIEDVAIKAETRAVMIHLAAGQVVFATKIVDVSSDRLNQLSFTDVQRLTDLQRVVDGLEGAGVDTVFAKMKDVGY